MLGTNRSSLCITVLMDNIWSSH